jgi:hypothetical protein
LEEEYENSPPDAGDQNADEEDGDIGKSADDASSLTHAKRKNVNRNPENSEGSLVSGK